MTTYLAAGFCCCLECCCRDVVDALKRLLGPQKVTKIFYIFLVVIFVVPAILVFFYLYKWKNFVQYFSQWFSCPKSSEGGTLQCFGASAVYRLSLSLLCLFVSLMLFMICRNKCSMVINQGLFFVKYIMVVALFIAFLWVPNSVFLNYAQASKYISIGFMVLQAIILIDLFYMAGIKMVKHYDRGQNHYAFYLIFLTVLGEAAAIGINILGYIKFSTHPEGCNGSLWVNIIISIILVILPGLQFFNFNTQNSLLTTALVSMYVSYLSFIAQFSYADNGVQCQRMTLQSLIADVVVSTLFFILTMYGSIKGGSGQVKVTQNGDINKAMGVAPSNNQNNDQQQNKENSIRQQFQVQKKQPQISSSYEDWTWVKWHFYMSLSSMYVGMLITNWDSASLTTGVLQSSNFGFWVRVAMSWATTILYIWTLLAPKVFPQRDFIVQ